MEILLIYKSFPELRTKLLKYPMIVFGTSALHSVLQARKRDSLNLKDVLNKTLFNYNSEKILKQLRKDIKNEQN